MGLDVSFFVETDAQTGVAFRLGYFRKFYKLHDYIKALVLRKGIREIHEDLPNPFSLELHQDDLSELELEAADSYYFTGPNETDVERLLWMIACAQLAILQGHRVYYSADW